MPPLPLACGGVWQVFLQLHQRRGSNGFGPLPLDEARLLAWCRLHSQRLTAWEVERIFALDDLWFDQHQAAAAAAAT